MTRTYLSTDRRRAQILDESQRLFLVQGYDATTIDDILRVVGIAKGTLYHHFSGKEAILVALVSRTVERSLATAREAACGPGDPLSKFLAVLAAARVDEGEVELAEQFHGRDAAFHLLTLTEMFNGLVPVLTAVVEEGISTGDFSTDHPREAVEIILAAGSTLLDGGIFDAGPDRAQRRLVALVQTLEQVLGARGGAAVAIDAFAQRGRR